MKKFVAVLCVLLAGCATVPYTGPLYDNEADYGDYGNAQAPSHREVKQGIASNNNMAVPRPYVPVVSKGQEGVVDSNEAVDIRKQSIFGYIGWRLLGGSEYR